MNDVPLYRLYMLRAMYLLVVVAMGSQVWPEIVSNAASWERWMGVTQCMLGAFSALCLLGLRYPLHMLPVLLWEALWKTIWLLAVPLPQWLAHGHIDPAVSGFTRDCSFVVLVYIAIPWGYVVRRYFRQQGEPWGPAAIRAAVR
jgi:hypothetical protein